MEQLIKDNRVAAWRTVQARARLWNIPHDQLEDIYQTVVAQVCQEWKPGKAKDPKAYYLSMVYIIARRVIMDMMGYHNGDKKPQSVKAAGEQATKAVGLYRATDGESMILDERILQTVPSAEDVYLATVPTKRQVQLRTTVQSLPEPHRTALVQQFYDELSVAESATKMGKTDKEVRMLRSAAMRMLRRNMAANV